MDFSKLILYFEKIELKKLVQIFISYYYFKAFD